MTTIGPGFASWAWISHSAVFTACQIPLRSALPSMVRGAVYFAAGAAAGGRGRGLCCADVTDATIPCTITAATAMLAMDLLDARIQILPFESSAVSRLRRGGFGG